MLLGLFLVFAAKALGAATPPRTTNEAILTLPMAGKLK